MNSKQWTEGGVHWCEMEGEIDTSVPLKPLEYILANIADQTNWNIPNAEYSFSEFKD